MQTSLSIFDVLKFFAVFFFAPLFASVLSQHLIFSAAIAQLAIIVILFILFGLLSATFPRAVLAKIWGDKLQGWRAFCLGALSSFVIYPAVGTIGLFIGRLAQSFSPFTENEQAAVASVRAVAEDPVLFALYGVAVVFFVPLIEEFLFRGILQSWLREKLGIWFAVINTSLFFSLLHYTPSLGPSNWQYVVPLFFLSLFLGFLYERMHSLWAPIGLHVIFNAATITMITFQIYGV